MIAGEDHCSLKNNFSSQCCRKRDLGMQTCGMTYEQLDRDYNTCTQKACGENKICLAGAAIEIQLEKNFCPMFEELQEYFCLCVPFLENDTFGQASLLERITTFYAIFLKTDLKRRKKRGQNMSLAWMRDELYRKRGFPENANETAIFYDLFVNHRKAMAKLRFDPYPEVQRPEPNTAEDKNMAGDDEL